MAVGQLGGLIVTLGLDAVQFFTGLSKSEVQAKKFADRLEKDINKGLKLAKQGFTVVTTAALAAGVAFDQLVKHTGDLKDLEEVTGVAAETLGSYSTAAAVANTTTADVGASLNKLEKNLTGVDDESKAAGAAMKALGLDIKEFKNLKPEERVDALAKAFGNFADSPEKAAVAIALMGKAGAQMLPFLKEIEGGLGRQRILTQAQIEAADAYSDRQKALTATLSQYAQVIAVEALPAVELIIKTAADVVKALVGIDDKTDDLTRDKKLKEFGKDVGEAALLAAKGLGILAESLAFVTKVGYAFSQSAAVVIADLEAMQAAKAAPKSRGFLSGLAETGLSPEEVKQRNQALDDAVKKREETIQRANKAYRAAFIDSQTPFTDALAEAEKRFRAGPGGGGQGQLFSDRAYQAAQDRLNKAKPKLKFEGAADKGANAEAERLARAQFESALKQQERLIKLEQDLAQDRTARLRGQLEDEQIGFREYYSERVRIADEANQKIAEAQLKQIDAAEKYKNQPGLKEDERLAREERYQDLLAKRADSERAAGRTRDDSLREGRKALRDYEDSVDDLHASILEMSGDLEAAARIRFTQQNRSLRTALEFEGNAPALKELDAREKQELSLARLTRAQTDYSFIVERLGIEQARIDLATQRGAQTTLDGINAKAQAALRYSAVLEAQLEVQRLAAQDLTGPARTKAELDIARLEVEIDALKISANDLENTLRTSFAGSFAQHLDAAINRTESLGKAFKGVVRDITDSVTKLATNNIGEALFGSTGLLGRAPGFIAGLFGGGAGEGLGGILKGIGSAVGGEAPEQLAGPTDGSSGGFVDKLLTSLGFGAGKDPGEAVGKLATQAVKTATSTSALDAALVAGSAGATGALTGLTAAATAAAAALSSVAFGKGGGDILSGLQGGLESGGGDLLSGLFDNFAGFFAEGGSVAAAAPAVVGERGAEAFVPNAAAAGTSLDGSRIIGDKGPSIFRPPAAGTIIPHERVAAHLVERAAKVKERAEKIAKPAIINKIDKATESIANVSNKYSTLRNDSRATSYGDRTTMYGDTRSTKHGDVRYGNSVRNLDIVNNAMSFERVANAYNTATRHGDIATRLINSATRYGDIANLSNAVTNLGDVANISRVSNRSGDVANRYNSVVNGDVSNKYSNVLHGGDIAHKSSNVFGGNVSKYSSVVGDNFSNRYSNVVGGNASTRYNIAGNVSSKNSNVFGGDVSTRYSNVFGGSVSNKHSSTTAGDVANYSNVLGGAVSTRYTHTAGDNVSKYSNVFGGNVFGGNVSKYSNINAQRFGDVSNVSRSTSYGGDVSNRFGDTRTANVSRLTQYGDTASTYNDSRATRYGDVARVSRITNFGDVSNKFSADKAITNVARLTSYGDVSNTRNDARSTLYGDVATSQHRAVRYGDRSERHGDHLFNNVLNNAVEYGGDVSNVSRSSAIAYGDIDRSVKRGDDIAMMQRFANISSDIKNTQVSQLLSRDVDMNTLAYMLRNFGGHFAEGGVTAAGKPIIVGEHGPEIFQPFAAGRIVPNDELGAFSGGDVTNILNVVVRGDATKSTADQIALRSAAALRNVTQKDG